MIQIIGIMIGGYIFTRMLEVATTQSISVVVRLFAILTILLDLLCIVFLLGAGSQMAAGLR